MYYSLNPTNSDLQHHGILGQKWGRRNGPPYPLDGSVSTGSRLKTKKGKKDKYKPVTSKTYSKRKTNASIAATKKDINKMSNQELRDSNERLRLEQEHARLTGGMRKSALSQFGERVGSTLIQKYGDQVATAIATTVTIELGKKALKHLMSYQVMQNGALKLI